MSYRIGLDVPTQPWMDYTLAEAESLEALVQQVAWKMPQKVWYREWRVLRRFAALLNEEYVQTPRAWWCVVKVVAGQPDKVMWRDRHEPQPAPAE